MRVILTRSFSRDGERFVAGDVLFVHPVSRVGSRGVYGALRVDRTEILLEPWTYRLFLPDSEINAFMRVAENRIKKGAA